VTLKVVAPVDSEEELLSKPLVASSIIDGRYKWKEPKMNFGPPLEIYHEAFRHFLDNINRVDIPPDKDIIRKTVAYMQAASAIYPDKRTRGHALNPLLQEIIGTDSLLNTIYNNDRTCADGVIELYFKGASILILLKEDENEIGNGGCDPSMQARVSAAHYWAQSRVFEYNFCHVLF
jgi:hypothetical protein